MAATFVLLRLGGVCCPAALFHASELVLSRFWQRTRCKRMCPAQGRREGCSLVQTLQDGRYDGTGHHTIARLAFSANYVFKDTLASSLCLILIPSRNTYVCKL
eukprot:5431349-Pyramimonas_sp.AAC.1